MDIMDIVSGFSKEKWQELTSYLGDLFAQLADSLQTGANEFLSEMVGFVLHTPFIAAEPVLFHIWSVVRIISFAIIGWMFVWEGFKKVIAGDNLLRTVEFKDMFVRLIYGLILAVFSLDMIDILIGFNNALVDTIKNAFPVTIKQNLTIDGTFSFIMTVALIIVQMVLGVKLILQYWMRMAEIWLMAVLSPIMYTLWINPNWSGYLGSWFKRLFTTIFTTFVWALILAIYSGMVSMVASAGMLVGFPLLGPIAGICLSIAMLMFMIDTPSFFRQFMDSQPNALQMAKSTLINVKNSTPVGLASKAIGFMKPKSK